MSGTGRLLERAVPLFRLPGAPDQAPEVTPGGDGLRAPGSDRVFPYRNGVLDLLGGGGPRTLSERALDTPVTAWLYDRGREELLRLYGLPSFAAEVAGIQERLQIGRGDVVLDLACGHGNFTAAWAERVGPTGLVVGLDISAAMLARAAARVRRHGLAQVLLVRGDALALPFASGSLAKVNCSGGFHAFPDLRRALAEIARVSTPGAVLTASMFAARADDEHPELREGLRRATGLHFVSMPWLGQALAAVGYVDYRWTVPRAGFGYASARRPAA